MSLETYAAKRNFKKTPEPQGKKDKAKKATTSFVIQKHAARRLHYDFRLEMEGTLKSWAVTKGPCLVPGEKRLAVHVEDHPLEYGGFEGTIPKGEYGGGSVIVWDRGKWKPIGDAKKGFAKGHLEFELAGEKLKGRWHLVRMAGKPREKRENWLLIKGEDEHARAESDPDILEELPLSVLSGRPVDALEGEAPGWSSKTGKIERPGTPAPFPGFIEPALASLRRTPPSGKDWLHEIKFDGYRLQAHLKDGKVRLFTRSGHNWTERFGKAVTGAIAALPAAEAVIDGELVVEGPGGASDFSRLQADLSEGRTAGFVYYGFDLLHLDGRDIRGEPLSARKAALEALIPKDGGALRYSEHFVEKGEMVLNHACRLSLEGIISKKADAPYRSGRGKDWVKSKCTERQEFVIAGYAPSTVSQDMVGSLALGVHEGAKLVHAGRVGTGFSAAVARDLKKRLAGIESATSPFAAKLSTEAARDLKFVKPELVAEVEFAAWTADGSVRHASFRGLREDKSAAEVVRETKAMVEEAHARFGLIAHTGTHAFGWITSDLNPEGAIGEAHLATAEKGAATAAWQAQGFVRLLAEVASARLADWLPAR